MKGAPIALALALSSNFKTLLERVSKDKRSSLLGLVVSVEAKTFYGIGTSPLSPTSLSLAKIRKNSTSNGEFSSI